MKISLIDRSNYLRGLLLLIRKDHTISGPEKDVMMRIGKALGFDKEFCERALHEILDNKYIEDEPPGFQLREVAEKFIRDGLTVGLCDHEVLHTHEEEWLRRTAEKNGLDAEWFNVQLRQAVVSESANTDLEVYHLIVH